jgi:hypothetical protein
MLSRNITNTVLNKCYYIIQYLIDHFDFTESKSI